MEQNQPRYMIKLAINDSLAWEGECWQIPPYQVGQQLTFIYPAEKRFWGKTIEPQSIDCTIVGVSHVIDAVKNIITLIVYTEYHQ